MMSNQKPASVSQDDDELISSFPVWGTEELPWEKWGTERTRERTVTRPFSPVHHTMESAAVQQPIEPKGDEWWPCDGFDEALLEEFLRADENGDGKLSPSQRQAMSSNLALEHGVALEELQKGGDLTFEQYLAAFLRQVELTAKAKALSSEPGLLWKLAECLPGGSMEDPLGWLAKAPDADLQMFRSQMHSRLDEWFEGQLGAAMQRTQIMRETPAHAAEGIACESNDKYAVVMEARYKGMDDYLSGLEEVIGSASPNIRAAMEAEHCRRDDSDWTFSPSNYTHIKTTPKREWQCVTDTVKGQEVAEEEGRTFKPLDELMQCSEAREAGLIEEEVMALRLYTGPMFMIYNAVLRNFPQWVLDGLKGNKYPTTIHVIVSGIIKLSKVMKIPDDRFLYRGLKDLHLPDKFKQPDKYGIRGGVEPGLMSTTLTKEVATQYAIGAHSSILFEIEVGATGRGASLGFLSQYPHEDEILFPPLTFVEAVGETRHVCNPGRAYKVVPLRITSNVVCSTIEQLLGKRKKLLISTLENVAYEVKTDVQSFFDSGAVEARLKYASSDRLHGLQELRTSITEEVAGVLQRYRDKDNTWFNSDDANYEAAMREAVQLKKRAVGKFEYWLTDVKGDSWAHRLAPLPLLDVSRMKEAELIRRLQVSKASGDESSIKDLSRELCVGRGVLHTKSDHSLQEVNSAGEMPLHVACCSGDTRVVGLLLDAGCDANGQAGAQALTPVAAAAMMGHDDCVLLLIARKADVLATGEGCKTCLAAAAERGQLRVVRHLLSESTVGMEARHELLFKLFDLSDAVQGNCLVLAIMAGHVDVSLELMQAGGRELVMQDLKCLHIAAFQGQAEIVRELVKVAGRELVMACHPNGLSCLMTAAAQGSVVMVQELVTLGDKELLMLIDEDGKSCLSYAAEAGHSDVVRVLVKEGGKELMMLRGKNGWSCLFSAAWNGRVEVVLVLVQEGGKELMMLTDKEGKSCLFYAAWKGRSEVVRVLVQDGGKELMMLTDEEGCTALMSAAENASLEGCQALIDAASEGDAGDKRQLLMSVTSSGRTCLMYAVLSEKDRRSECVLLLARAGGSELVGFKDATGWNVLHRLVWAREEELVTRMCKQGGQGVVDLVASARKDLGGLQLFRGLRGDVVVNFESREVEFVSYSTVLCSHSCPAGRKAYYELEILEVDKVTQFGFCSEGFEYVRGFVGEGVGDDAFSWSVDGSRSIKFHSGELPGYDCQWSVGDVLGLACDFTGEGKMYVSVNGSFSEPNGMVFESLGVEEGGKLYAAFTGYTGKVRYNLGQAPFKHSPPGNGYVSFVELAGRGFHGGKRN